MDDFLGVRLPGQIVAVFPHQTLIFFVSYTSMFEDLHAGKFTDKDSD